MGSRGRREKTGPAYVSRNEVATKKEEGFLWEKPPRKGENRSKNVPIPILIPNRGGGPKNKINSKN